MPSIESLQKKYQGQPFKILMVDVQESSDTVKNFMKKNGYSFNVVLDTDNKVSKRYRVTGHPVKFLLDDQGTLIAAGIGYRDWDTQTTHKLFDALLREHDKQ